MPDKQGEKRDSTKVCKCTKTTELVIEIEQRNKHIKVEGEGFSIRQINRINGIEGDC